MQSRLGAWVTGKPWWLRLLVLMPLILLAGARCYVGVQNLAEPAPPSATSCVAEEPLRVEYLSTAGVWSPTSTPGSVRALVYRPNAESVERRAVEAPDGWRLAETPAAQRRALEPYIMGDYLVTTYPPSVCSDSTIAGR